MTRTRTNSPVPRGLPSRNVIGPAGAMVGFDELDPQLRAVVHQAPLSVNAQDLLAHQRTFGVESTRVALLRFIRETFPGWQPIEEHPNYRRASRPLTRGRQ